MHVYDRGRSKRAGLRIPVDFEVRCELTGFPTVRGRAVNMSTGGIFITTAEPIGEKVKMNLEFIIPDTLSSIQVQAESVWSCSHKVKTNLWQGTGIRFVGLAEPYLNLFRDYSLSRLYDDDFVRREGIGQILSDLRNLPPLYRLKAYHILIRKESKLNLPS
jgi:hypothetical protein